MAIWTRASAMNDLVATQPSMGPPASAPGAAAPSPGRSRAIPNLRRRAAVLTRHRVGLLGLIVVACVVLVAILAPIIAPYPPNDTVTRRFAAPSDRFWLGADEFGRD